MSIRPMTNTNFYTASEKRCRDWVEQLSTGTSLALSTHELVAGLVPHAGWAYSGAVAGQVWKTLQEHAKPKTIVLFGAVHYPDADCNAVDPSGAWETPAGPVEIDSVLAEELIETLDASILVASPGAHEREHSLEVQLPFIRLLFPESKILPIAAPPDREAEELGRRIGEITRDRPIIAVGSTDLTHYGERYFFAPKGTGAKAHAWMRTNDRQLLILIEQLRSGEVMPTVEAHHNACGPGAIAATLAFAKARGASHGTVLDYRTSFDVAPDAEFEMAVGYAGVVF